MPVTSVPVLISTPIRSSFAAARRASRSSKLGRIRGAGVEQDDARGRGVDPPEVRAQAVARQLGDLPGHLDAGRPGADDDEGQPRGAAGRVVLELGELERAEDPAAHLERVVDRLHAGGMEGELVVAEVRLR